MEHYFAEILWNTRLPNSSLHKRMRIIGEYRVSCLCARHQSIYFMRYCKTQCHEQFHLEISEIIAITLYNSSKEHPFIACGKADFWEHSEFFTFDYPSPVFRLLTYKHITKYTYLLKTIKLRNRFLSWSELFSLAKNTFWQVLQLSYSNIIT